MNEKSAKLIANLERQNQELEKMVKSSENELMAQNSARENDLARLRGELDNLRIENRSGVFGELFEFITIFSRNFKNFEKTFFNP